MRNNTSVSFPVDAKNRFDLAITHMDPGSSAERLWAGEFDAGHAQLQVEGKVVDIESGEIVAAFAERRRYSGALGAEDLGGDAGPRYCQVKPRFCRLHP